ncbi:TRAP-type mannitol/chloroaromatic compound transport system, small permease component [Tranquillimonas rosea]|uniref:TRAP transporter small permease protein n=1 Tax=Tranquillimonas rosea TaxID=641238 RepID=A0A1H9ST96_9RHOB|nr:TRAP transporter small permease subunit [Tranquillimonas rosea]SER88186.1 TRAP-type mannitol/chloroaromatic compound transport system, small permease component [Tranquillimonas rosea]
MIGFIRLADSLSSWFGKAFAWLIILMSVGVGLQVLLRYVFNSPTSWSLDVSYIMYGSIFMVAGAYTLSRNGHVRGDFLYRLWPIRVQATVDLILYLVFFFPAVLALIFAGWKYAARAWRYTETSVFSPAGVPVFQFKSVIVLAGILLFIQGLAQVLRCIICLRDGYWLQPEEDVLETEDQLLAEAAESRIKDRDQEQT